MSRTNELGAPVIQYEIRDQNIISPASFVSEFTYNLSILGETNVHKIKIVNPQFQGFDLRDLQERSPISFRFGWSNQNNESDIQKAFLIDYDIYFDGRSSILEIIAGDRSIEINSRGVRNRGYTDKLLSDIVTQIASLNNLETDIEPTKGLYTVRQIHKPDLWFIKNKLIPKAISNNTGRGDYDVFFDGKGVLHFHPPRFSNQVYRRYTLNTGIGPIFKFRVMFRGELSNSLGGLSSTFHGYDPFEKQSLSFTATNDNTREKESLGTKTFHFDVAENANESRFYHNGFPQTQEQVENEAKVRFYTAHRRRYTAIAIMEGDPLLIAGKSVAIFIPTSFSGYHVLSGRFLIERVKHVIDRKGFFSILHLSRGAILDGQQEVNGVRRRNLREEPTETLEKRAETLS